MARKKKGSIIDAIGSLVLLILFFVAIFTPLMLFLAYAYNWDKSRRFKKYLSNNNSDFWLTQEEKTEFKSKYKKLATEISKIEKAEARGKKENIPINKDGSFSARSTVGKEIRNIIDTSRPIVEQLSVEIEDLSSTPQQIWNEFNLYVKREYAFLYSLYVWFTTTAICYGYVYFKSMKMEEQYHIVAIITAIVSILSYFIFKLIILKNKANKYTPMPPIVTVENVGQY